MKARYSSVYKFKSGAVGDAARKFLESGAPAPEGATIDPDTGAVTFNAPPGLGSHEITVRVSDDGTQSR